MNNVHYSDYLQLDKILNAQFPESDKQQPAHDEMLFIVIHQAYELWFKQLLYEVNSVNGIMQKPSLNDNSPELQTVVHRLSRCVTILKVLVHQIDVMETMTPMDFLDFRDMLRPASGFQSVQFKVLEASLGLKYDNRHGQQYYISQLRTEEVGNVKNAESNKSLLESVNTWLERMPFFEEQENWKGFIAVPTPSAPAQSPPMGEELDIHKFWVTYREIYRRGLADVETANLEGFNKIFLQDGEDRQLSARACRAALFITLHHAHVAIAPGAELLVYFE